MLDTIYAFFSLNKKYLLYNLIVRNLKIRYRGSYVGAFWSFLVPVLSATVYFAVFKHIMKFNVENYFLYIISGIFAWSFISTSLIQGNESITINKSIASKVYIAPCAFPLAETLTHFINFILSMPVLIFIIIIHDKISLPLLLLPFIYFAMLISTYALATILAVSFVFLRDLRHLISIGIQLLFYGTPIIYPANMLPEKYYYWGLINPFWAPYKVLQQAIVESAWPSQTDITLIILWPIALCTIAMILYKKKEFWIVEEL